MRKKIIYYIGLVLTILVTCICTALFWRFMSIIESGIAFIFVVLFALSPVIFVALDNVLVKFGIKYGAIEENQYLRCYIIDNVIYAVVSPVIVTIMGYYEIVAVQSGGDLSGIEVLFYYIGLGGVELINIAASFIFAGSKTDGGKRIGYIIVGIILLIVFVYLKEMIGF